MEKAKFVVYTDGSYKDDVCGYSLFGYLYKENDIDKKQKNLPKDMLITTSGFLTQELINQSKTEYGNSRYEMYSKSPSVLPLAYVSAVDTAITIKNEVPNEKDRCDIVVNSAYAEAHTMLLLLQTITNIKNAHNIEIDDILIKTDSQMLIYVLEAIKRGDSVEKYAYYTVYKPLKDFIDNFIKDGNNFNFLHIKGHTNNIGNEIVDKLANFAREERVKKLMFPEKYDDFKKTSRFDFFKLDDNKTDTFWTTNNIPDGLFGTDIFFITEESRDDRILYSFKYPKKKEAGEKDGTALIGIFMDKNKDDFISEVIKSELEYLDREKPYDTKLNSIGVLNNINLLELNDPYANLFRKLGYTCLNRYANGDVYIQSLNKYMISRIVRPGILGVTLIESLEFQKDILTTYFKNEDKYGEEETLFKQYPGNVECKIKDITNSFFDTKTSKKTKLVMPIVKDITEFSFSVNIEGKETLFTCVSGTDIPPRNFIKKLEKLDNVKVKLVYWKDSPLAYSYAYIFDGYNEDGRVSSLWYNKYSSTVYIKK